MFVVRNVGRWGPCAAVVVAGRNAGRWLHPGGDEVLDLADTLGSAVRNGGLLCVVGLGVGSTNFHKPPALELRRGC